MDATKCMLSSPPKFKKQFPIVENRYEDFVALHINSTMFSMVLAFPQLALLAF
jgi:hypothetical protein